MTIVRPGEAVLVLEDGRVFRGETFGAAGQTVAEVVFSTSMTGYQETLTDPSYKGQIVVMTAPHIGNTGINDEDYESTRIWVDGYVVRDPSRVRSNWRSQRSLDAELKAHNVVGISGVDTRALTRHLRERGTMRGAISSISTDVDALVAQVNSAPPMLGSSFVDDVTTEQPYVLKARGTKRFTVAAVDLGIKQMTPQLMARRGIEVHVLPSDVSYEQIQAIGPDGLFMSNGPGDPATTDHAASLIESALADRLPYFGICLGNQVFGRALGLNTYKLQYGHRGINQPVQDLTTGKVEITAHNHGFAVDAPRDGTFETPFGPARVTHICLNDDVVEGLALIDRPGFSVQYHPEAAAGPHDADYLFDRFIELMDSARKGN